MSVKVIGKHEKDSRACRDALALTLNEMMAEDKSIVYVDCDLMGCINTKMLRKNYPDRAFEAGIAEANGAGVAAGLAAAGKKVFFQETRDARSEGIHAGRRSGFRFRQLTQRRPAQFILAFRGDGLRLLADRIGDSRRFAFIHDLHEGRQALKAAREAAIGVHLDKNLLDFIDCQPGFQSLVQCRFQHVQIAGRRVRGNKNNRMLPRIQFFHCL